jgi:hypothetical protein
VSELGAVPARVARAVVFASVAVALLLLLRAKSDGANPPLAILLLSFGFVAALAWIVGSRELGVVALLSALVATQLALHVGYLFVTTGELAHSGGAGLFCSPATVSTGACTPTSRGGVVLLAVQLTVALALAFVMRGADAECWQLARPRLAMSSVLRRLFTALTALTAVAKLVPTHPVDAIAAPTVSPRPPRRLLLAHDCGRRGPPVGRAPSSMAAGPALS